MIVLDQKKGLLKKFKTLLEKNLTLNEIEQALGVASLKEKPQEVMEIAYHLFQNEEYHQLQNYIFGNQQINHISVEFIDQIGLLLENGIDSTNIEDYAIKYYIETRYHQIRR